jgi:hypothetical protein
MADEAATSGMTEYDGPQGWAQVQRHGTYLTKEEMLGFFTDYLALLRKYGHEREDAPPGAKPVAVRFFAVPEPGRAAPESDR